MNTKTEQISSGLVAVAWMDYSCDPLVRLSDAEAIIADLQNLVVAENQRKQQLEEDRDTWKERAEFSYAQRDNQSAALKLAKKAVSHYLQGGRTDRKPAEEALAAIDALGEVK